MPYAELGAFDKDRRLSAVSDLFTVDLVARYVGWKLAHGTGKSSNVDEAKLLDLAPVHQM
jgi:hypothetical protein